MEVDIPQLQELILSAVPAYEAYLLQLMGRPYILRMPVLKPNPDNLQFTFEAPVDMGIGFRKPERIIMKVEYARSMKMATLRIEYWPDIDARLPYAVNEPNLAQFSENLTSPTFVFGWLKKMAGSWGEGVEPEDMDEARMVHVEKIIAKTDEVLAEHGYALEATDYLSYAGTLDTFLLRADLPDEVKSELEGVGDVVRKVAHAYGAAKGMHAGLKQRWSDFKTSVKNAYTSGQHKGYKAGAGHNPKKTGIMPVHPIAATGLHGKPAGQKKRKLKRKVESTEPEGELMTEDNEFDGLDPYERLEAIAQRAQFEAEFRHLDVPGLLVVEEMVDILAHGSLEEKSGGAFKALVGKLKARGGVRNPAALAAWIGRKKYGAEKFAAMSQAGRKKKGGKSEDAPEAAASSPAVDDYKRMAGITRPMGGWYIP